MQRRMKTTYQHIDCTAWSHVDFGGGQVVDVRCEVEFSCDITKRDGEIVKRSFIEVNQCELYIDDVLATDFIRDSLPLQMERIEDEVNTQAQEFLSKMS